MCNHLFYKKNNGCDLQAALHGKQTCVKRMGSEKLHLGITVFNLNVQRATVCSLLSSLWYVQCSWCMTEWLYGKHSDLGSKCCVLLSYELHLILSSCIRKGEETAQHTASRALMRAPEAQTEPQDKTSQHNNNKSINSTWLSIKWPIMSSIFGLNHPDIIRIYSEILV